jgi:predicted RNA-binding protein with PIN domain
VLWVVDGNNVMGAGADGWWNDPPAAAARLAVAVAAWTNAHDDPVVLLFDGAPVSAVAQQAGGRLDVRFAERQGRDAADDDIVALVADRYGDEPQITVVTSDRGLVDRLPPGVAVEGAGGFRRRLGLASGAPRRARRGG